MADILKDKEDFPPTTITAVLHPKSNKYPHRVLKELDRRHGSLPPNVHESEESEHDFMATTHQVHSGFASSKSRIGRSIDVKKKK